MADRTNKKTSPAKNKAGVNPRKEYHRAYYQANKEEIRERWKVYRDSRKERNITTFAVSSCFWQFPPTNRLFFGHGSRLAAKAPRQFNRLYFGNEG